MDSIAILDFGSQYAQLIARRVRELEVYCELFPWDAPVEQVLALHPKGFILSGGPASVYEPGAPFVPPYVFSHRGPVLGICYGMQALTQALGGEVAPPPNANMVPLKWKRWLKTRLFHWEASGSGCRMAIASSRLRLDFSAWVGAAIRPLLSWAT